MLFVESFKLSSEMVFYIFLQGFKVNKDSDSNSHM